MTMRTSIDTRRFLARLDTRTLGHLFTDTLIIGAGVAGLRCAIEAAPAGQVILLAKEKPTESNTYYAQGGIAAVLEPDDSIDAHLQDTLNTGCGLTDPDVAQCVVSQAPQHIRQLQQWNLPFDTENNHLALGREGGHSHHRIVHALGDATGMAIAQCLLQQVQKIPNLKCFEDCFVIDLLTENNQCLGALTFHPKHGYQCIWARQTVLATGGAGRLYRETTNPPGATADGLAIAYRAGAVLTDLEFMQFHPTTLYIAGAERTLITEALRGAGARLVDRQGQPFMQHHHDMADLAPRDIVCRAIYQQMTQTNATNVFLDVRHLGSQLLAQRFPTISALCKSFDIDVDTDLIPVRPSAHYMVGGVKTDLQARTNIANLYCCGEAAATGLHGSNRLASNSLLEGLVFGQIAGQHIAQQLAAHAANGIARHNILYDIPTSERTRLDISDVANSLRAVMWRNVGVQRCAERLSETIEIIDFWRRYVMDKVFDEPTGWQCQNMLTVCRLMAESALLRQESRGTHFRSDFSNTDDQHFKTHLDLQRPNT